MSCTTSLLRTLLISTGAAMVLAAPAQAQFTWTNAAGGNWSIPGNWGGTAPPAGGGAMTTLTFGAAPIVGASYIATNDLTGIFNLNQLTFNGTAGAMVPCSCANVDPAAHKSAHTKAATPRVRPSRYWLCMMNLPGLRPYGQMRWMSTVFGRHMVVSAG